MSESSTRYETGVIHGRFQILHNDHLAYLLAGKERCRHLVVGITNPDPFLTAQEEVDPKRSDPLENPLTYYERYVMVAAVLTAAGIDRNEFSIVPFPINLPDRYRYYVPMDGVFFLTIYDDWGRRKLAYFQSLGLVSYVLREVPIEQKGISASEVRDRILAGRRWEHLVPGCVPALLRKWRVPERLKRLTD